MSNEDGSLTITFNGEIYDFYVLRASLSHRGDTFLDHWLRHDLREMSHDLLLDARARQRGYLRPEAVQRHPKEHGEGRADHHARLWTLLNLELWHRMFVDQACPTAPPVRL